MMEESTESTESIHWWMMDDGRKYRKYTVMDDRWWKKVQKVQKVKMVYYAGGWLKVHKV